MAKPTPVAVPSDDCPVMVDGETYYPHEGETVWIIRGIGVAMINGINKLMSLSAQADAAEGEPDEEQRILDMADGAMQGLCRALAPRVVRWDWTDLSGRPLAQPDGTPEGLMALETEELAWLIAAMKGETPSERKNGSRPSPTTSSATAPPRSRTSRSGGRSHPKR